MKRSTVTETMAVRIFVESFSSALRSAADEIERQQFTLNSEFLATRGLPEEERIARLQKAIAQAIAAAGEKLKPDLSIFTTELKM